MNRTSSRARVGRTALEPRGGLSHGEVGDVGPDPLTRFGGERSGERGEPSVGPQGGIDKADVVELSDRPLDPGGRPGQRGGLPHDAGGPLALNGAKVYRKVVAGRGGRSPRCTGRAGTWARRSEGPQHADHERKDHPDSADAEQAGLPPAHNPTRPRARHAEPETTGAVLHCLGFIRLGLDSSAPVHRIGAGGWSSHGRTG